MAKTGSRGVIDSAGDGKVGSAQVAESAGIRIANELHVLADLHLETAYGNLERRHAPGRFFDDREAMRLVRVPVGRLIEFVGSGR